MSETESVFSTLSDDLVLNIFLKLKDDPRDWPRLACVSTRFSSLIDICCQIKCSETILDDVSDFISSSRFDSWAFLYQIAVRCPGLVHSGVLPENCDPGLDYQESNYLSKSCRAGQVQSVAGGSNYCWPLFDNLLLGTASEARPGKSVHSTGKINGPLGPHLASTPWGLSCEQGKNLLSTRFRGDCLYLCNWPGCIHSGERRKYMLFRGIFKDFKQSGVWKTVNDRRNKRRINLSCAFCTSKQSWNLHSACCLRRYFGNHGDGEPVIRAYVCENGHVSGAWSGSPSYLH